MWKVIGSEARYSKTRVKHYSEREVLECPEEMAQVPSQVEEALSSVDRAGKPARDGWV
jgi:hypothetical protein